MHSYTKKNYDLKDLEILNRKRSEILLLKRKLPDNKVTKWPQSINKGKSHKEKLIYSKETRLLNKKKVKMFTVKAYDPLTTPQNYERKQHKAVDQESTEYLSEFIKYFILNDLKPKPTSVEDSTLDLVQNSTLELLDKTLVNMASTYDNNNKGKNSTMDWRYIIGTLIQLGLPKSVINRVEQRMATLTGKNSTALSMMNNSPNFLPDLTSTAIEDDMREEIEKMIKENQVFAKMKGDEPFVDAVEWLENLQNKSNFRQSEEIDRVYKDYNYKVLDSKPSFF